ncbi:hypothetical protein ATANTOWER_020265 [Ataeniobius toweri]|uniref:Secreted protein n=1 Tax=Ataeniobius toweri TaxID=208326 RepID=A0ABU7C983_9TELE|nr:hypothetical protein [Ataeniobius toweri]
MKVGMCDCDCVCLFFVSGWVLGCSLSWITLFPPCHTARRCTCGSRYSGPGVLMCAGSLPVAACRGLGPWDLSGLCLGGDVSRGLGSLGSLLDLLRCRWLPAGPVGSSLQLPGVSALWLLGGSPGIIPRSSLGGLL